MGKLVCLLGKSSTGKDSIYRLLLADGGLGLSPMTLYTTRPPRSGEENGREYIFVSESRLKELEGRFAVVEKRVYNTVFGPWFYCTLDDGALLSGGHRLCIAAPEAVPRYFAAFGKSNVIPLYIHVNDAERLRRSIDREERQEKPAFDEVCRRYLADEADFSREMLEACALRGSYLNADLSKCFLEIRNDLTGFLNSAI